MLHSSSLKIRGQKERRKWSGVRLNFYNMFLNIERAVVEKQTRKVVKYICRDRDRAVSCTTAQKGANHGS